MSKSGHCLSGRAAVAASLLSLPFTLHAQCDPHWEHLRDEPRGISGVFYDSVRHETVLVGYKAGHSETWIWNGRQWHKHGVVTPDIRLSSAAAFDAARGRGVLFGGDSGGPLLRDTWEWDGATWTRVATSGPPERSRHAMAYDAARSRVILFGGRRIGEILGDTWEWDGAAWTPVATTGVSPRYDHTMFTDPLTRNVVLFGGKLQSGLSDETWTWNGDEWKRIDVAGPPPRYGAAAGLDRRSGMVLFHGGTTDTTAFDDTWSWDGHVWTRLDITGAPQYHHALVYDDITESWTMVSGEVATWTLADGRWSQYSTSAAPDALGSSPVWDPVRSELVLIAANPDCSPFALTMVRRNDRWVDATPLVGAPDRRTGPGVGWDGINERIMLFGGVGDGGYRADTWEWDGSSWEQLPAFGPLPRQYAGIAFDAARNRVVLFGGAGGQAYGDTWEWDGTNWTLRSQTGPGGIRAPRLMYDPVVQRVRLFGLVSGSALHATWTWDGNSWQFEENVPGLLDAAVAYDAAADKFITFGWDQFSANDSWEWDRSSWTQLSTDTVPYRQYAEVGYDVRREAMVLTPTFLQAVWERRRDNTPRFLDQPDSAYLCHGARLYLFVDAVVRPEDTISWLRDGAPIPGEHSTTLRAYHPIPGVYQCVINGDCGDATSDPATVTACDADFDCNGVLNSTDFTSFLTEFFQGSRGADYNEDGTINSQDFFNFLAAFFAGC